jgi:16S rRNA (uracil1498-N3)-methyltransferase
MQLPYFFTADLSVPSSSLLLDEEQSRHAIQVLRMRKGDVLILTDGKGHRCRARIESDHKKACSVIVDDKEVVTPSSRKVRIAISLLKNPGRFEWFLEKATEIGIEEVIPLLCDRTTREHFRYKRMQQVVINALLQSQQAWMPLLHAPLQFDKLAELLLPEETKLIAHCMEGEKNSVHSYMSNGASTTLILIGPEGDFTSDELRLAFEWGCHPVSLGESRLRAETAGIAAAALLKIQ